MLSNFVSGVWFRDCPMKMGFKMGLSRPLCGLSNISSAVGGWWLLREALVDCTMCTLFSVLFRTTEQAQNYLKIWLVSHWTCICSSLFRVCGKYRLFFSKGPTQKSSKYGIGPSQQDKIAKYTGPTQSYQMSELLTKNFFCQKNYCFVELQSFQSYTHFITMVRVWTVRQRTFLVEQKLQGADLAQITAEYAVERNQFHT